MLYVDFTAGGKDYKLRLSTRNVIALERQLGSNPIAIFNNGDSLPTVTEMVNVLYASLLQLNHGISLNDAYDIFDEWLADNHTISDFVSVIVDIYKVSGLLEAENNEKN